MNGKDVKGRQIKVDFDVKGKQKSSYRVNTDNERNRLYNKEPIKLLKSKQIKKERDRKKEASLKQGRF